MYTLNKMYICLLYRDYTFSTKYCYNLTMYTQSLYVTYLFYSIYNDSCIWNNTTRNPTTFLLISKVLWWLNIYFIDKTHYTICAINHRNIIISLSGNLYRKNMLHVLFWCKPFFLSFILILKLFVYVLTR